MPHIYSARMPPPGKFFMLLSSDDFFQNHFFFEKSFRITIRVTNSLDPDLGPNCLEMLSAYDTRR